MDLNFNCEKKSVEEIHQLLQKFDKIYVPILSSQVNIKDYALKLFERAEIIYLEQDKECIGFLAYYKNRDNYFITSFCVEEKYHGIGYAKRLLTYFINYIKVSNTFSSVMLEVNKLNTKAIIFYKRNGFVLTEKSRMLYNGIKYINDKGETNS